MNIDKFSLTAELFKNSKYFQDHVKNETREQRINCKFCHEVIPSFVECYINRENQLGHYILLNVNKIDEILHLWEILYEKYGDKK